MVYLIYHNYLQIKEALKCVVKNQCKLDRIQKQMILKPLNAVVWLDQCYDRIPIHYNYRTLFVGSFTRQTYPAANEVKCVGGYKNACQLDPGDDNSWYHSMPAPVPLQLPRILATNFAGSIPKFTGYEYQPAGTYRPNQPKSFWDNILHHNASKAVLTKISRQVLMGRQIDHTQNDHFALCFPNGNK